MMKRRARALPWTASALVAFGFIGGAIAQVAQVANPGWGVHPGGTCTIPMQGGGSISTTCPRGQQCCWFRNGNTTAIICCAANTTCVWWSTMDGHWHGGCQTTPGVLPTPEFTSPFPQFNEVGG